MKTSIVCLLIIGVVLIVALFIKGDVKASFKVVNTSFTLETTQKR